MHQATLINVCLLCLLLQSRYTKGSTAQEHAEGPHAQPTCSRSSPGACRRGLRPALRTAASTSTTSLSSETSNRAVPCGSEGDPRGLHPQLGGLSGVLLAYLTPADSMSSAASTLSSWPSSLSIAWP